MAAALAVFFLGLTSCSSGPKIYSNQDPMADFSTYGTYGFQAKLSTDRPGYTSVLSQYLKMATTQEMEARGYKYSDNPDLTINFNIDTKEKVYSRTSSSPSMGAGYRSGRYGAWGGYGTETTVSQYTEGTVHVDLIDSKRKQLVWEGYAVGKLTEDVLERLQEATTFAVGEIFLKYPYQANSGTPVTPQKK
jgi:hypothetical protein